ncbi:ComEC/Rec2 family competence protein [Acinetobacter soli]|uniref:ComEC/Rec2 family competence protein n=1 Tax=Acinetobacter soli TaxID=487316 RepID=UPI003A8A1516
MEQLNSKLYALPARDGDCLLFQFQNHEGEYRHILIDGGNRTQLDFNNLKTTMLEILKNGGNGQIDLVVVTHSDDDHISGILKILGDNELNQKVKKIWFNSERTISEFLKKKFKKTQNYTVTSNDNKTVKSSRIQDNDLYNILDKDDRWHKEIILAGKTEIIDNLEITVLSPFIENLKKLNLYWPTQKKRTVKSSATKEFDYNITFKQFEKNMPQFKEDSSPVNGASIALLLKWEDKKFLLLSDAHPTVIVSSLEEKYQDNLPLEVDLFKVSHHGSAKNTSDELLNMVDCKNFIISTNANKKHYHPNKETLSRILINKGISNTEFYFTYSNVDLKRIFNDLPSVKMFFPTKNEIGVCFEYEHSISR